jgi:hypothetical protein
MMVDLKFECMMLDEDLPNADSYLAHAGFLLTARNLVHDIIGSNVLQELLQDTQFEDYHIVVCGHSMGAAVACFVTYFLRRAGFLNSRCYAYCIPVIGNELTCELFEEFVLSVVTGHDIVSRFGEYSLEIFKSDLQRLLRDCEIPKHQLLMGKLFGLFKKSNSSDVPSKTVFELGYQRAVQRADLSRRKWVQSESSHLHLAPVNKFGTVKLGPAGRILYLERIKDFAGDFRTTETAARRLTARKPEKGNESQQELAEKIHRPRKQRKRNGKYFYVPRWADKEEFQEFLISSTCISDHTAIFEILQEYESIHPDHILRYSS